MEFSILVVTYEKYKARNLWDVLFLRQSCCKQLFQWVHSIAIGEVMYSEKYREMYEMSFIVDNILSKKWWKFDAVASYKRVLS